MTETGLCRLAALKYALELINEREAELGIPVAQCTARPTYGGDIGAIIQFVVDKGDEIFTACLLNPSGLVLLPNPDPPAPRPRPRRFKTLEAHVRQLIYARNWRQRHRASCRAYYRDYYRKNRRRILAKHKAWKGRDGYSAAYYRKNAEAIKARVRANYDPERQRIYYLKNIEKIKARKRQLYRQRRGKK